jgi:dTDP-4-dehydrorhamnose reductase
LKVLLLGADGQVGWELRRSLLPLGEVIALDRSTGNLSQTDALRAVVNRVAPDVIVNAAAYTAVDAAEADLEKARLVNAEAPGVLGQEAARCGAWLVHFSTDYVFDGGGTRPWREEDPVAPLSAYGITKLEGEQLIRASGCRHLILRTSWVYASRGRNFLRTMLKLACERDALKVVDDQYGAPTGAELIADVTAHAVLRVRAEPSLAGTYHLVAGGETTWFRYACHVISLARNAGAPVKVAPEAIFPCATDEYPTPARRPRNSRLSTEKLCAAFGLTLPAWQVGVERAVKELIGNEA